MLVRLALSFLAVAVIAGCHREPEGTEASRPPAAPEEDESSGAAREAGPALEGERAIEVGTPPMDVDLARRLASGMNAFGLDLYGEVRSQRGNLVLSPASIAVAFAMLHGGARGETAREIERVLRFGVPPEEVYRGLGGQLGSWNEERETYELAVANRIFADRGLRCRPAFLELTSRSFGAPLERVGFRDEPEAARRRVNAWVVEQTAGRIVDLVPPGAVDGQTRMALVNALYFKGRWARRFPAKQTRPEPFAIDGGERVPVPMMRMEGRLSFASVREDEVRVLELPYEGDELALVALLPFEPTGLPALEERASAEAISRWIELARPRDVTVKLPRFRIEPAESLRLSAMLKRMGLARAFDARAADLSGIASDDDLHVDEAYHKAYVDVNEEGTEAAAGTAIIVRTKSADAPPIASFHATHPFLFLIRDKRSGAILMLGRVVDPRPAAQG